MQFASPLAARCCLIHIPTSPILLALSLLFLAGCGRSSDTPMNEARRRFQEGKFDDAITLLDPVIAASPDVAEKADLLALKGRCYWELAHQTERVDTRAALLQKAVRTLAESIDAEDNAEARHLRALVYEALDEDELAAEDKLAARELDESYQRLQLSERPEEALLELSNLDRMPSVDATPAEESAEENKEKETRWWKDDQEFPVEKLPSDPQDPAEDARSDAPTSRSGPLSRFNDLPWPRKGSEQNRTGDVGAARGRSGTGLSTPAQPRRDPGPGLATDGEGRRSPSARERSPSAPEDGANDEDVDDGDSERTTPEGGSEREEADSKPDVPPPPSSTWQPLTPHSPLGNPSRWLTPPSTGLVGPQFGGQSSGDAASPFGSPPSTGIMGPSGFSSFSPATPPIPGGPTLPTTGVGGALVQPALPGGGPLSSGPQMGTPPMPQTPLGSGLPSQFQPRGTLPSFGPAFPIDGPHYSPLRPSPLTVRDAQTRTPQVGPRTLPQATPAPSSQPAGDAATVSP